MYNYFDLVGKGQSTTQNHRGSRVKTRELSGNTRVAPGHVIVLQQVTPGTRHRPGLSEVKETMLVVDGPTDCTCEPIRVNASRSCVAPFIGKRLGHVAAVILPGKKSIKLKLTSIQEVLPDE